MVETVLSTRAPAKINWTLEVLGRRPDGYHDIASVMSTVSVFDTVRLTAADNWQFAVDGSPRLAGGLSSEDNLVVRAASVLARKAAIARGLTLPSPDSGWPPPRELGRPFRIELDKRIPVAAGLGGGSSDAAAILRLLYTLWNRPRGGAESGAIGRDRLLEAAAEAGSDVSFFIGGGTQLVRGRGEILERLGDPADQWLVVMTPSVVIERKTARMYTLLSPEHYTSGGQSLRLASRLSGPQPRTINDDDLVNVFDGVAHQVFPRLRLYRESLSRLTGAPAHLCGAGPSLFALCPNESVARDAAARLREMRVQAFAARVPERSTARAPSPRRKGEVTHNPWYTRDSRRSAALVLCARRKQGSA